MSFKHLKGRQKKNQNNLKGILAHIEIKSSLRQNRIYIKLLSL